MPALKPTRFMTSSPQMASMLQKRCPRIHEHQQLVGGRAEAAAFYPLGLVRAILQGIRLTAIAKGAAIDHRADEREAIHAVMNSNSKNTPWASGTIAPDSAVKLLKGGVLPIGYSSENFKHQYLDEYTGEVLPGPLIQAAIVEELNYFNGRVWQITTKDEMFKVDDYVFVRCRWIMANKGDAAAPALGR